MAALQGGSPEGVLSVAAPYQALCPRSHFCYWRGEQCGTAEDGRKLLLSLRENVIGLIMHLPVGPCGNPTPEADGRHGFLLQFWEFAFGPPVSRFCFAMLDAPVKPSKEIILTCLRIRLCI